MDLVVSTDRDRRRGNGDIKNEISALEAERKALRRERRRRDRGKYEDRRSRLEVRRSSSTSSSSTDSDREGTVRIEKDRRGRLNLVQSRG